MLSSRVRGCGRRPRAAAAAAEGGSAPVEFVLVGGLLTMLTLGVLQLGLALHVRNTLLDAAAEGARFAALADNAPEDGIERARELIATAVGAGYAENVTAGLGDYRGHPAVTITVRATLPLIGLFGVDGGLEVSGHAAIESAG